MDSSGSRIILEEMAPNLFQQGQRKQFSQKRKIVPQLINLVIKMRMKLDDQKLSNPCS
jgi:hypothetical protein